MCVVASSVMPFDMMQEMLVSPMMTLALPWAGSCVVTPERVSLGTLPSSVLVLSVVPSELMKEVPALSVMTFVLS